MDVKFTNILKFILGGDPTPEERKLLFKEAAFMALARATSADTNIQNVEVETVQQVLNKVTGEDVTLADIRLAARSDLFERQPLEKYLSGVGGKLDAGQRVAILHGLGEVIRSDQRISPSETRYFDMVAHALKATPSEIFGLAADGPQPIDWPKA